MPSIDHGYWARITLVALVERLGVSADEKLFISYGVLARRIGYPLPHTGSVFGGNIGRTLAALGDRLAEIRIDGVEPPAIYCLVVRKDTRLPSDGLILFQNHPGLSLQDKRVLMVEVYREIAAFGERWNRVLEAW